MYFRGFRYIVKYLRVFSYMRRERFLYFCIFSNIFEVLLSISRYFGVYGISGFGFGFGSESEF